MKLASYLSRLFKSIVFVAVLVALVACAAPTQPASPEPSAGGPKYGGTLRLAYIMDVSTLDPIKSTSLIDRALPLLYNDGLVKWVGRNDEEPKLAPCLATSWDISPDGLTYTFKLREGVRWQNIPPVNGREFTSADVKYGIERMMDPESKSPMALYLYSIKSIETPDKYTLILKTGSPDPGLLGSLASGMGTVAHEVIEQDGDASKTIIGVGPFIFEKYTPHVGFTFRKNPDYWDKGKPYVDRVELTYMPDAASRVAAFRAGQIDRLVEGKTNLELIKSTVKDAQFIPGVQLTGSAFIPSLKYPDKPWANKKVRQALQYAIDYDGLINAVLNGQGSRTDYLSPSFVDYGARPVSELPQYDKEKAKAMLAEAGYPDGFKATFIQHTSRLDAWGGAVEPLTAMFKEVGVDCDIRPMQQTEFVSTHRSGDYEFSTMVVICAQPELDSNLTYMYMTGAPYNRARYSNPKVDELLQQQRVAFTNIPERQRITRQIMEILHEDVPIIPLYYQWDTHITQPWVKGWDNAADPNTGFAWQALSDVWIDK